MKFHFLMAILLWSIPGLNAQPHWESTIIQQSDYITRLAVNEVSQTIMATNYDSQLIRLKKSSSSWEYITNNTGYSHIYEITSSNGIWYIHVPKKILVSKDDGETWIPLTMDVSSLNFGHLCVSNNLMLFQSVTIDVTTLHISLDQGSTYSQISASGFPKISKIRSYIIQDSKIHLAGYGNDTCFLYKSDDFGNTWVLMNQFYMKSNSDAELRIKDNIISLIINYKIYISNDSATTWEPVLLPQGNTLTGDIFISNHIVIVNTYKGLYISYDRGENYVQVLDGSPDNPLYEMNVVELVYPKLLLSHTEGFLFSENGGMSWITLNTGLKEVSASCICTHNNYLFTGLPFRGVYRSSDGMNWDWSARNINEPNTNGSFDITAITSAGENIVVSTKSNIYYSNNNGDYWNMVSQDLPGVLRLNYSNGIVYAGTYMGLYYSNDSGVTWKLMQNGPKRNVPGLDVNNNIIVAEDVYITFNGTVHAKVLRSEDLGSTFNTVNEWSVFVNIDSNDSVMIAANWFGGLYKSYDKGKNWVYDTISKRWDFTWTVFAMDSSTLFISAEPATVLRSDDNGRTWSDWTFNINSVANQFSIFGNYLFAALSNNGVKRLKLKENENSSSDILVYPNPTYDVINIDNPNLEKYDIQLFDINGKSIMHKSISDNKIIIDMRDIASGVYIFNVAKGNTSFRKKICKI